MNISYKHLLKHLPEKPSKEDLSINLFQLGHEHELIGDIFDIEHTPNRGDCLSIKGILRDLNVFYEVKSDFTTYEESIDILDLDFKNKVPDICPKISFLKISIEQPPQNYHGSLNSYFADLDLKKNNFFTDISNYISYEMGQPTHCYDAKKIKGGIVLDEIEKTEKFKTLFNEDIEISGKNAVFISNNEIINLAGVMGGYSTACDKNTNEVIVECAYFNPADIIGKSIKYGINSDAAYKFERHVDPDAQESVLRRFIQLTKEHCNIKKIEILKEEFVKLKKTKVPYDLIKINQILGTNLSDNNYLEILSKLNFKLDNEKFIVPSYRSDIKSQNDLSEEVARAIGYDNLPMHDIKLPIKESKKKSLEDSLKSYLVDNGFYELINFPFVKQSYEDSISIDNPLDVNKGYFRKNLKNSLIEKLIYNEKRQKDCIKFFEISDLYSLEDNEVKKVRSIGIACSGRVGKNYENFSKKIDEAYLQKIIEGFLDLDDSFKINLVSRKNYDSKNTSKIYYFESPLDILDNKILDYQAKSKTISEDIRYKKISELPSSSRDLSFSISDPSMLNILEDTILNFKNEKLKETFVFDYFLNKKTSVTKIGFRFVFQCSNETIKDADIDKIMQRIIQISKSIKTVTIPGLNI